MQFVGSRNLIDSSDHDDKINSLVFRVWRVHMKLTGELVGTFCLSQRERPSEENVMNWVAPIVEEICVGMEVTSYESADLDVLF